MSDPAPAAPAAVVPASDAELPRSIVKRLIKGKLDELAAKLAGPDGKRHDYQISKDALIAFCESAKVFISYLAATANDICKESKRATVSGDDVLQALDDMDFGEFAEPLKEYMQGASNVVCPLC